jgi:hypothetical protein
MPNCKHIFSNNSKTHKKGEVCNSHIRKKEEQFCWRHKQIPQAQLNDIDEIKPDSVSQILDSSSEEQATFIQLENSA